MTAGVNYIFKEFFTVVSKKKRIENVSRPRLSEKVAALAVGRGKCGQKWKNRNEYEHKPKKKTATLSFEWRSLISGN